MVVNQRLQAFAYGALLAVILGWVLHVGKDVFVPVAFGVVVVYIVSGLANLLSRIPLLAPCSRPASATCSRCSPSRRRWRSSPRS